MPITPTRRSFLAALAATPAIAAARTDSSSTPIKTTAIQPPRKLNIAIVGTGGRGMDHVRECAGLATANVVALCDVDAGNLTNAGRTIIKPPVYVDFREMLEKQKDIEAVIVATPDHTHAVITAAALRAGKHVYCEKPLAHTIHETRAITDLAARSGLVTQMGIQIHSLDNYRRVVDLIKAGAIGVVSEVHIWNNRHKGPTDAAVSKPPASLHYDLWLGPLSSRPYHSDYHPFNWRWRWDFGTGLLGDIGCHLMDIAFWALDLRAPTTISAEGSPLSAELCPDWIIAKYDFTTPAGTPLRMTWYDPPKTPPALIDWKLPEKFRGEGVMFLGDQGMLYTNYGEHVLLPEEKFKSYRAPATMVAPSIGHVKEWIVGCLKNDPTLAETPFSYGGPLTETALLGTIAFRSQKTLQWDARTMRFPNAPEAEKLLAYAYRDGWTL